MGRDVWRLAALLGGFALYPPGEGSYNQRGVGMALLLGRFFGMPVYDRTMDCG
jgi:hypothetical protein